MEKATRNATATGAGGVAAGAALMAAVGGGGEVPALQVCIASLHRIEAQLPLGRRDYTVPIRFDDAEACNASLTDAEAALERYLRDRGMM